MGVSSLTLTSICSLLLAVSILWASPTSGEEAKPYRGKVALFLLGEQEYGTSKTLPAFARQQLEPLGIECRFVVAQGDERNSPLCHTFHGIKDLAEADILILSLRRRYPKTNDLKRIREWIKTGQALVALRTSSHAFGEREKGEGYQAPAGHAAWNAFDVEVLGARYQGHGKPRAGDAPLSIKCWVVPSSLDHPLVRGREFSKPWLIENRLYRYTDQDPGLQVLLRARDQEGDPVQPVAWINEQDGKRVFYTSMGTAEEMALPQLQALLKAAVQWGLDGKQDAGGS